MVKKLIYNSSQNMMFESQNVETHLPQTLVSLPGQLLGMPPAGDA